MLLTLAELHIYNSGKFGFPLFQAVLPVPCSSFLLGGSYPPQEHCCRKVTLNKRAGITELTTPVLFPGHLTAALTMTPGGGWVSLYLGACADR